MKILPEADRARALARLQAGRPHAAVVAVLTALCREDSGDLASAAHFSVAAGPLLLNGDDAGLARLIEAA